MPNYSSKIHELVDYEAIDFAYDPRAGLGYDFYNGCFGEMNILYKGVIYKTVGPVGFLMKNIIYIPDDTSKTTDAYINAALSRIKNYLNTEDVSLVYGGKIEDIDEELLKEFIEKGRKAKRINFPYTNKEEILKKLSLVSRNNELLNAGYILFAKEAKLEMQMAIFATETKLTFLDMDQVFGNIFELIETGESYIRKNIKWPVNFKSGSMERVEIPEIPLEAIRETLINSLIHRDFKNPKSNEIAIYKDRIEIFNPGEFPEGFKPEDFIEGQGSIPRNPLIANTLYLSKDIEKWGSGFRRITEAYRTRG